MAESTVADPPPPPSNGYDDGLPIPPMDSTFFSQNDVMLDDIDFDFSFDDLYLPSLDDAADNNDNDATFIPVSSDPTLHPSQPEFFNPNTFHDNSLQNSSLNAFKTTSPEFPNSQSPESSNKNSRVLHSSSSPEICEFSGDISTYLNVQSPENNQSSGNRSYDVSVYMNVPSPESNGSNKGSIEARVLNCPSPVDSQGSGNCRSNLSEADSNKSVNSSPDFDNNSIKNGVVDQQIKLEGYVKNENNGNGNNNNCSDSNKNCLLKRKKDSEDLNNKSNNDNLDSRTNKYQKANSNSQGGGENSNLMMEEDEKRKARLMRNRESAQLSRQRKKHYVEELEDKVRTMHSTIQDLNTKISYVMAENATLRQQLGGGAVPPPMAPPSGMYPAPPMMYPWMPVPPYMVKPQGSQVPLVPIPRLKPQQAVLATKTSKKAESKKSEGKTKKVASVSFLGLLFFMLLFGGLVPMVHVRYGGTREALMGGSDFLGNGLYEKHRGRVLTVNGSGFGEKFGSGPDLTGDVHCSRRGHGRGESNIKHGGDEFVRAGNGSEPLMASLYVPRNDKLVKIDGNLIIHSVLASEKAMASREDSKEKKSDETGLAVPGDLAPAVPIPGMGRNAGRNPPLALGSSYAEKEKLKSTAADGRLHQWFREGLAGPMLSSGMCTEVFQFEVSSASAPGAIIPATSSKNVSAERSQNSAHLNKGRNRRILHGLPIPLPGSSSVHNVSEQHAGRDSPKGNFSQADSGSSMVVSVLVDPREAADTDGDNVMGAKSLPRIFVVVLIDSVKYVTYSCMLPFIKGSGTHLVTA